MTGGERMTSTGGTTQQKPLQIATALTLLTITLFNLLRLFTAYYAC
jgi:hypothetical protein